LPRGGRVSDIFGDNSELAVFELDLSYTDISDILLLKQLSNVDEDVRVLESYEGWHFDLESLIKPASLPVRNSER